MRLPFWFLTLFSEPCFLDLERLARLAEDRPLKRGYDGDISIEPHMVRVFHDSNEDSEEAAKAAFENFIEYGKRLEMILSSIKSSLPRK